jgi:hypothetical protein
MKIIKYIYKYNGNYYVKNRIKGNTFYLNQRPLLKIED